MDINIVLTSDSIDVFYELKLFTDVILPFLNNNDISNLVHLRYSKSVYMEFIGLHVFNNILVPLV